VWLIGEKNQWPKISCQGPFKCLNLFGSKKAKVSKKLVTKNNFDENVDFVCMKTLSNIAFRITTFRSYNFSDMAGTA
jgi:hypothetical protein